MIGLRKKDFIGFCFAAFAVCSFAQAGADTNVPEKQEVSAAEAEDNTCCDGADDTQAGSGSDTFKGFKGVHFSAAVEGGQLKRKVTLDDNMSEFNFETPLVKRELVSLKDEKASNKSATLVGADIRLGGGWVIQDKFYLGVELGTEITGKSKSTKKHESDLGSITNLVKDEKLEADRETTITVKNKGLPFKAVVQAGAVFGGNWLVGVEAGIDHRSTKCSLKAFSPNNLDEADYEQNSTYNTNHPLLGVFAARRVGNNCALGLRCDYLLKKSKKKTKKTKVENFENEYSLGAKVAVSGWSVAAVATYYLRNN